MQVEQCGQFQTACGASTSTGSLGTNASNWSSKCLAYGRVCKKSVGGRTRSRPARSSRSRVQVVRRKSRMLGTPSLDRRASVVSLVMCEGERAILLRSMVHTVSSSSTPFGVRPLADKPYTYEALTQLVHRRTRLPRLNARRRWKNARRRVYVNRPTCMRCFKVCISNGP